MTSYAYNAAGDLKTTTYSDGTTPAVGYAYDRLGRQIGITNGSAVTAFTLNDAGSVLIEAYTNGPLNGRALTNGTTRCCAGPTWSPRTTASPKRWPRTISTPLPGWAPFRRFFREVCVYWRDNFSHSAIWNVTYCI